MAARTQARSDRSVIPVRSAARGEWCGAQCLHGVAPATRALTCAHDRLVSLSDVRSAGCCGCHAASASRAVLSVPCRARRAAEADVPPATVASLLLLPSPLRRCAALLCAWRLTARGSGGRAAQQAQQQRQNPRVARKIYYNALRNSFLQLS